MDTQRIITKFKKRIFHQKNSRIKEKLINRIYNVIFLSLPIFSLIFLFYWFYANVIRIVYIEAKYHTQLVLKNTPIQALFIPQFSTNLTGDQSKFHQGGIYIPKIFVDEPIIFNVDAANKNEYIKALKQGIAHTAGTSLPGDDGLGYYFAHSSTPALVGQYNAVFYLLGELNPKDDIYLWNDNQKYHYQVTQKTTTKPDNLTFLTEQYDSPTIILQTCWPPGTTRQRLLVTAKKVE